MGSLEDVAREGGENLPVGADENAVETVPETQEPMDGAPELVERALEPMDEAPEAMDVAPGPMDGAPGLIDGAPEPMDGAPEPAIEDQMPLEAVENGGQGGQPDMVPAPAAEVQYKNKHPSTLFCSVSDKQLLYMVWIQFKILVQIWI